jgi:hypothetical protein
MLRPKRYLFKNVDLPKVYLLTQVMAELQRESETTQADSPQARAQNPWTP